MKKIEDFETALKRIADMKQHHAGQTPNEYHMQEIAKEVLLKYKE